jgi:hypothetical protein
MPAQYPGIGAPPGGEVSLLRRICNNTAILAEGGASAGTPGSPSTTTVETVQGIGYQASATDTRPNDTTAYAALDVVSTLAGSVLTFAGIGPAGGGKVILDSYSLRIDAAASPAGMGNFRLHLYNAAPTAIADNSPFNLPAADRSKYLGFIETPTPLDLGDTLWSETEAMGYPIRKEVTLLGDTVYGIRQTVNAFTPTAQTVKTDILHSIGV